MGDNVLPLSHDVSWTLQAPSDTTSQIHCSSATSRIAPTSQAVRLGMDKEDQCNWALEGKYWLCNGMRCLANSVISEAAGARGFGSHSFCLPVIDLQL